MNRLKGIPLSPGFAKGKAWLLSPVLEQNVPRFEIAPADVDSEMDRFKEAVRISRQGLEQLGRKLAKELEGTESRIIDAHILMLEDPGFLDKVADRIRRDHVNAEQAVAEEIDAMAAIFERMESEYLRARSADVRDVGKRLVNALGRTADAPAARAFSLPKASILVARELLPSETAELDKSRVAGIVTETGGPSSHAAILARALGIPSITGIENAVREVHQGAFLLLDSEKGEVVLLPTAAESRRFNASSKTYERHLAAIRAEEWEPSETRDGVRVGLWANAGVVDDAHAVQEHHLAGIGLLRTEFLFLNSPSAPGLEKQCRVYRKFLSAVSGKPVTIRMMDLGADKTPPFLASGTTRAAPLAARGLRFALLSPRLFKTQLRAVVRAAGDAPVRILFPMVTASDDIERAIEFVREACERERASRVPEVGAMIETPSALFELDAILGLADFLSVGTNDLSQYMLAASREETDAEGFYSVLYPGVLKALKTIVDACNAAGKPVSICGESAGNPAIALLFVGMGYRHLSMSPLRAAAVRHAIRASTLPELEHLAFRVLAHRTVRETRRLLKRPLRRILEQEEECDRALLENETIAYDPSI